MVLVDSSIWSLALRRRNFQPSSETNELRRLIIAGAVAIIGPIRQEVLSGIADELQYHRVRRALSPHVDTPIESEDWERAAQFHNQCRRAGIQGALVDFVICAVAIRHEVPVFTTDRDFLAYQRILPLRLHHVDP